MPMIGKTKRASWTNWFADHPYHPAQTVLETDALVIGAGPIGLWAVFELGLQGLTCEVVDTLDEAGGQCVALYADKPIYDIPGLPVVSGSDLTQSLLQQIKPFHAGFHFGHQVSALSRLEDGRWHVQAHGVHTGKAQSFAARSIFIAAGVGAFVPKSPKLEGVEALQGQHVFFQYPDSAPLTAGKVCVLGGEQAAVSCVLQLIREHPALTVTLIHRRNVLKAQEADLSRLSALQSSGRVEFVIGQVSALLTSDAAPHALRAVQVDTSEGNLIHIDAHTLVIQQGLSPKLGPLADWGLAMARKQLSVDLETFSTSQSGIYAMGDIVQYPGKRKLIVSGFHEATQAAFAAAAVLLPEQSQVLQYTTSSALLQKRLGLT